ncbi:YjbQ family protein [Candidatus Woesearchaeota archaeon]|nr:YjbQ family protein [Candidatus Woesearchaeota archaeon]
MIKEFKVKTNKKNELRDISKEIISAVEESGVDSGCCAVYCPHTTAGITINEGADPAVKEDVINYLNKLIPESREYKHSEGNSDAHIKSSVVGASEIIIIKDKKLVLGTWQKIFFAEFDGPRERKIIIKVIKNEM